LISFLSFVATTAFEKIPGAGLEGCLYTKNNTQTTARTTAQANRFSFTMLFLLLYPASLDTAVNRWALFTKVRDSV
jgi:hypothetical protein